MTALWTLAALAAASVVFLFAGREISGHEDFRKRSWLV
jgi:hypothetical protein